MTDNIVLNCKPVNVDCTFTSGDYVVGDITLELSGDFKINTLSVKFKGKSLAQWSERHGRTTTSYHSKDKYFSITHFFIKQDAEHQTVRDPSGRAYSNRVGPGSHVYPFTFQFPARDMPSSHDASPGGKIVYTLEANMSRSMRMDSKVTTELTFVSRGDLLNIVPLLMSPQYGTKDKKMLFTSGTVAMDVSLERMGYYQGEVIQIVAGIHNKCSRQIKPKYRLYYKVSFFAKGSRKTCTKDLIKLEGDPIPGSTHQTVTRIIPVPLCMPPSILNCSNVKVEYRLEVYLDVKYASNPKIKFPIVILPAPLTPAVEEQPPTVEEQPPTVEEQPPTVEEQPPSYSGFGLGASASPHPPARSQSPQDPPMAAQAEPPPPYGAYGMYPSMSY